MKGQTLITLLFFVIVLITITSVAIIVTLINSISTSTFQQGVDALSIAESGAETAMLKLLRDPNYVGENLTVGQGSASVSASGTNPTTIVSQGQIGNFIRKIQVQVSFVNGALTIESWKEIL